jgi:hypothetical protein
MHFFRIQHIDFGRGSKMKSISISLLVIETLLFFSSIAHAQSTANPSAPSPNDAENRVLPSPLLSPPFPGSDWDGGPVIGEEADHTYYPLQKMLGLDNNKNNIRFYGWVDVGGNLSTSTHSNVPTSYDLVPNAVELDQVIFRVQRDPDTVQTDHADWGFMFDNIYGTDYRYTIAKGIFSNQLLGNNNLYGYDPTQIYGLLYVPHVAEGMLIKVGRFISPSDIEAQWAPDNYLYSHSLMFTVDPYTFTGAMATIKLSKYFQFEVGAHAGNDVAPWSDSANLNGMVMARWVSPNNQDSLYGGLPSIGKGDYTNEHDNLQMAVVTWGHRFSDKVHMMTEAYYMWQRNADMGGTVINGPPASYFEATGPGTLVNGVSSAVGLVNYFQLLLTEKNYLSIRNDFLNDPQGNRTGYVTAYSSHTIGFVHHFTDTITIRPEIRYERAYAEGVTPYDNGVKKDQFTAAMDLIVRY